MNTLDLIILALVAWGFFRGFRKGFFYIILSLGGILAGFFLATRFSGKLIPYLNTFLQWEPQQLAWLAYIIVFLIVLVLARLISYILERFFTWTGLGWLNRLAGGAVSAVKYLLLAGLLFTAVDSVQAKFHLFPDDVFAQSTLYRPLVDQTKKVIRLAGDWKDEWKNIHAPGENGEAET